MEGKESVPLGEIALTVTPRHTPPAAYIICVIFTSLYTKLLQNTNVCFNNRGTYKALRTVKANLETNRMSFVTIWSYMVICCHYDGNYPFYRHIKSELS